jgi:hypothetical protein
MPVGPHANGSSIALAQVVEFRRAAGGAMLVEVAHVQQTR